MQDNLRKTGIDLIGDVPWGTHMCQFFQNREDLLELLIPYFKAGLENNETCFWVVAEPLSVFDAHHVLMQKIHQYPLFLNKGQLEIIRRNDLYAETGEFDRQCLIDLWTGKIKSVLLQGYDGLRVAGSTLWPEKTDWKTFTAYEAEVNRLIADQHMLALCTYSMEQYKAVEIMDVIQNHEFVLVKHNDNWKRINKQEYQKGPNQTSLSKYNLTCDKVKESVREGKEKYRLLADNIPDVVIRFDRNLNCRYINPAIRKLNGLLPEAVIGRKYTDFGLPAQLVSAWDKGFAEVILTGKIKTLQCEAPSVLGTRYYQQTIAPEIDVSGIMSFVCIIRDISEQKEAEKELKKAKEELEVKVIERTAELSDSEQQVSRIFETTDEGIVLVNIGGDIIKANTAAIKILRLESDKLQEQSLHLPYWEIPARWTVLNPDGTVMPFQQNPLARAITENQTTKNVEFGIKFDDGTITWLNSSTAPFINDKGGVEGIVFTFTDITEQKWLRDEKEQFTKRLIEVQEEERNRISRELHDDTAQWLALLTLQIDDIISKGQQVPEDTIAKLKTLRTNTEKALQEVRRFSHELRPSVLEHFGLPAALELIVSEFKSNNSDIKTETDLRIIGTERQIPKETELVLFRIAQESLSNIRKHARATLAVVKLKFTETMASLTISDDGCGFRPDEKPRSVHPAVGGLGLVGMRERAYLIGGKFSIKSKPGKGTTVSIKVPISLESYTANITQDN